MDGVRRDSGCDPILGIRGRRARRDAYVMQLLMKRIDEILRHRTVKVATIVLAADRNEGPAEVVGHSTRVRAWAISPLCSVIHRRVMRRCAKRVAHEAATCRTVPRMPWYSVPLIVVVALAVETVVGCVAIAAGIFSYGAAKNGDWVAAMLTAGILVGLLAIGAAVFCFAAAFILGCVGKNPRGGGNSSW